MGRFQSCGGFGNVRGFRHLNQVAWVNVSQRVSIGLSRFVARLANRVQDQRFPKAVDRNLSGADIHAIHARAVDLLNRLPHPRDASLTVHSFDSQLHITLHNPY